MATINPLKKEYPIFFFFPFYHTGGAEKVHLQIAAAAGGNDCIVFFTRKSADDRFLNEFKKTGCNIKNISGFTDNKWLFFLNLIYRGIISGYINKQKQKPVVFNGQCNFAYKISPWLKKDMPQIELIHSLNTFSYIRIPFLPYITKTVMISKKRIEDHKELYKRLNIPSVYINKIIYIQNAIDVEPQAIAKDDHNFTVLYAGRATEEKRIHLVAEIAKRLYDKKITIQFEIMGNVSGSLNITGYPFIKFHGNIHDQPRLNAIYSKAHILILTSSTEGFPMVIMEAMAHGCAILATAVGDIPYHVKNNENGFLFHLTENETAIIDEAIEKIVWLKNNRGDLQRIEKNNINYAKHNFGIERFNKEYRDLFLSVK